MLSSKLPKTNHFKSRIGFIINWLNLNWTNVLMCALLGYLLVRKNVTLQISFNNDYFTNTTKQPTPPSTTTAKGSVFTAKKTLSPQQKAQLSYVKRFAKVAQGEMHKYGIPASITLAQGLLESNAGKSPLASKYNNHFGIKCFSKKCKKGHCSNFSDDSHKDFFRNYPTAWESYRAHSEFLQKGRYQHLLKETSYKNWAHGLLKAGYATDQQYGHKLIRLIEDLELYRYDRSI